MPLLVRGFGLVILSSDCLGAHFLVLVLGPESGPRFGSALWDQFYSTLRLPFGGHFWVSFCGHCLGSGLWLSLGFRHASEKLGAIGHNANEGCAFFLPRHLFWGTVRTFCGPRFEAEKRTLK